MRDQSWRLSRVLYLSLGAGLGVTSGFASGCVLGSHDPVCSTTELNFPEESEATFSPTWVQQCVWTRETVWHDANGAIAYGHDGHNFATSWDGSPIANTSLICSAVHNNPSNDPQDWKPNDGGCQWTCELEAQHRGAVDADCAHDVEAIFYPLGPAQWGDDPDCQWAQACNPANGFYPVPPPSTLDPSLPEYGEEIYCIPDPTHLDNQGEDWDGLPPDEFPEGPAVRAWLTQSLPFTYDPWWLAIDPESCGLATVHSFGAADDACKQLCRDLVSEYYLEPFGKSLNEQYLRHNCSSFIANSECYAQAQPAPDGGITTFLWDTPNGQSQVPAISDVARCELFGPNACTALQSPGSELATDVGTLAASVDLQVGSTLYSVPGALTLGFARAPGCDDQNEPCTTLIETLHLTLSEPLIVATGPNKSMTLDDVQVSAEPGFGASYRGQLQIATGALPLTIEVTREDDNGDPEAVTLHRGNGLVKGSITKMGFMTLDTYVNIGPGTRLYVQAQGVVSDQ